MSDYDPRMVAAVDRFAHRVRISEALARAAGDPGLRAGSAGERAAKGALADAEAREGLAREFLLELLARIPNE